jgi:hypothetical protein
LNALAHRSSARGLRRRETSIPRAPRLAADLVLAVVVAMASCCLDPAVRAQEQVVERQSQGPFVAAPHAFSVGSGALGIPGGAPVDASHVRFRGVGVFGSTPGEFVPMLPPDPDYTTAAILQGVAPAPDIDAFSVGLDWVVSDSLGQAVVPPNSWAALTFSVTSGSYGVPEPNGRYGAIRAERRMGPEGAGGDVFSYTMIGSGLPKEFVDITQRAQDSSELALDAVGVGGPEIDAHDVFASLVWQLNAFDLAVLLPVPLQTPRVFFSVSTATIGLVPAAWWAGTTPSGATVLASEWTGGSWTTPTPFLLPSQLGLADTDELDALAVDWLHDRVLFSTKRPDLDQILYAEGFPLAIPPLVFPPLVVFPYRTPGVSPPEISARIGLARRDDIDALCALDPGQLQVAGIGIGRPDDLAIIRPPTTVVASVFRRFDPVAGQPVLSVHLAGWPSSGRGPGNAMFFVSMQPPTNLSALGMPIGGGPRNPLSPIGGDPQRVDFQMPPIPAGIGIPLWFSAIAVGGTTVAFAQPVRVFL